MRATRITHHYGFGGARLRLAAEPHQPVSPCTLIEAALDAARASSLRDGLAIAPGLVLGLVLLAGLLWALAQAGPDVPAIQVVLLSRQQPPAPAPPEARPADPPAAPPEAPPPPAPEPLPAQPPRARPAPQPAPAPPPEPTRLARPEPLAAPPARPAAPAPRPSRSAPRPRAAAPALARLPDAPSAPAAPRESQRSARATAPPTLPSTRRRAGPPAPAAPAPLFETASAPHQHPTARRAPRPRPGPTRRAAAPTGPAPALPALAAAAPPRETPPPRPAAVRAAAVPTAAPGGHAREPRLRGVPLGALASCLSDRREISLKQRLLAAVGTPGECVSEAGTYRFVETKNLNAFLMWVERAPSRAEADRCVELALALECVRVRGTGESRG